jgi:hypothetical protein
MSAVCWAAVVMCVFPVAIIELTSQSTAQISAARSCRMHISSCAGDRPWLRSDHH